MKMITSWPEFIKEESKLPYMKALKEFLEEEGKSYKVYPPRQHLFNAFKFTPLNAVKVFVLGQDPYHGPNQAHGLSFSVSPGCAIPPSLRNIFKELTSDLDVKYSFTDGCLVSWAAQGVLLLNSVMTVRDGQANSHQGKGWEIFTDKTISIVNELQHPIVFILWGAAARNKKKLLTNPNHLILESAHPSPLSAHNGFFGSKPFSKTNQFLTNNQLDPIDWLY
jgi:uracil-DNA glycosylase